MNSPTAKSKGAKQRKYPPHTLQLARAYNFPPLPDLQRIVYGEDTREDLEMQPDEYTGGILLAGRRIQAILKSHPPRVLEYGLKLPPAAIPGWTDGSHAWREAVYGARSLLHRTS
jgi:hypothetical protein